MQDHSGIDKKDGQQCLNCPMNLICLFNQCELGNNLFCDNCIRQKHGNIKNHQCQQYSCEIYEWNEMIEDLRQNNFNELENNQILQTYEQLEILKSTLVNSIENMQSNMIQSCQSLSAYAKVFSYSPDSNFLNNFSLRKQLVYNQTQRTLQFKTPINPSNKEFPFILSRKLITQVKELQRNFNHLSKNFLVNLEESDLSFQKYRTILRGTQKLEEKDYLKYVKADQLIQENSKQEMKQEDIEKSNQNQADIDKDLQAEEASNILRNRRRSIIKQDEKDNLMKKTYFLNHKIQENNEVNSNFYINGKRRRYSHPKEQKEERKLKILKDALKMGNILKAAKLHGVSGSVVRKWRKIYADYPEIQEYNRLYQENRCVQEKYSTAQKKQILLELKQGGNIKNIIAGKYRIHPTTLRKWEKKFGRELGFKEFLQNNQDGDRAGDEEDEFDEEDQQEGDDMEDEEDDNEDREEEEDDEDDDEQGLGSEIDEDEVDIVVEEEEEVSSENTKDMRQLIQEKEEADENSGNKVLEVKATSQKAQRFTRHNQFAEEQDSQDDSQSDDNSDKDQSNKDIYKPDSRQFKSFKSSKNSDENPKDNDLPKRKTRSTQKIGINVDNDSASEEQTQPGMKHLALMKIENDELFSQQSENGWFIFAADTYGVVRVYTIKKGFPKYSLYTSLVSDDKSEIHKIRIVNEQNYIIVLKDSRIEIWKWPKRQLYDFITLHHKAIEIAQLNYKNQTLYGVLETNRSKNSIEFSQVELLRFDQQQNDSNNSSNQKQTQKYNGKIVEKNVYSINNLKNPSNIQCIKILDDFNQDKLKYVVSFDNFLYIVDHTGAVALQFELDKEQEIKFIEPINNPERDRNYQDLLCASSKGWLFYISPRLNKIQYKKFLENSIIQALKIKYLQKGEYLIAVALPHCIRFLLGERLKDIYQVKINPGEICQNGFNIMPMNDPKNKMKIYTVYSSGKSIETLSFLTNNFL